MKLLRIIQKILLSVILVNDFMHAVPLWRCLLPHAQARQAKSFALRAMPPVNGSNISSAAEPFMTAWLVFLKEE